MAFDVLLHHELLSSQKCRLLTTEHRMPGAWAGEPQLQSIQQATPTECKDWGEY